MPRDPGVIDHSSWIDPTPTTGPDPAPLGADHITQWRARGAVLVDELLPAEVVDAARSAALDASTAPDDGPAMFGSDGRSVFPFDASILNALTLHPRLLGAVAQLLDVPVRGIRLTQSDLWVKHGRHAIAEALDHADQRMHVDYPNHSLTHPPEWDTPDAVEMIVYGNDVDDCDGSTAVVRRNGPDDPAYRWPIVDTPGVGAFEWVNDRSHAERYLEQTDPEVAAWRLDHLYAREERVRYHRGSVLLYRHDTWHRGTPVRPGATRVAHNLTFRAAASEWVSTLHPGWAWAMYRPGQPMERLIATTSTDQRCVLGFPAPGHPSWTPRMLQAVEARYGPLGMDITEYASAMKGARLEPRR